MNIKELKDSVELALGESVYGGEVRGCLMRVIKDINLRGEKRIEHLDITTGEDASFIISEDEEIISDDERIISADTFIENVTWIPSQSFLMLPSNIYKVLDIYLDGVQMQSKSYSEVMEGKYEDYYNANNRGVYLAFDPLVSTKTMRIRYKPMYPELKSGDTEYNGMPEYAYGLLETGVMYMLYSMPKYYKDRMNVVFSSKYENELSEFNQRVLMEESAFSKKAIFTY